jgi:hypothetical protein
MTHPENGPNRESPVDVIAHALREAATSGALPAHREPLLFRSVAMIAVQALDANGYRLFRKIDEAEDVW